MFYEISGSTPEKTGVFFTDSLEYPIIKYDSNMVGIPLPRQNGNKIFFEGYVFPSYESSYKTIWHLYLATIAHAAGHVKVTDYSQYQNWLQGKNIHKATRVIEYVENIKVNEFLKDTHPEYYELVTRIIDVHDQIIPHKSRDFAVKRFSEAFRRHRSPETTDQTGVIGVADSIYQSQSAILDRRYPFTENQTDKTRPVLGPVLDSHGAFSAMIEMLNESWCAEASLKKKMEHTYQEMAKDLHFDKIDFVPERFSEYLLVQSQVGPIVKQISSQLKNVPNAIDDSVSEDMGTLEMQKAIQAIASQNSSIQIFEQDDKRRHMEEWAIVVDTSSSMRIKFCDMKKLILCFAQAADDLVSRNGRWGLFCFDHDFSVVKANTERYDQTIRARIGGIEMGGLSYLPDAITLSSRMLSRSDTERRYLFVITDGLSLGYDKIDRSLEDAIRRASRQNINVVGIGIPQHKPTYFSLSVPYDNMRKMVSRFISMYTQIATSSL